MSQAPILYRKKQYEHQKGQINQSHDLGNFSPAWIHIGELGHQPVGPEPELLTDQIGRVDTTGGQAVLDQGRRPGTHFHTFAGRHDLLLANGGQGILAML
jgi:hypothetical protein